MSLTLRPYQQRGVDQLRAAYMNGKRSPLYVLPTGGGKTAVFSHVVENAVAKSKRVIILVHRGELLMQASRSLQRLGVNHGLISPKFTRSDSPIQIASVQTLVRRLDSVIPPDLIVVDEAHHAVAGTFRKIISAFPNAHVLGVTATACRTSGEGLSEIFDDLILGPSISELIREGFLVQPTIYAPPIGIDLAGIQKTAGDFNKKELGSRVDKPTITGSAVEHYIKYARGEPGIAFCVSIQHAEHVAAEFRAHGVRAIRVDGLMGDNERKDAIDGLGNGKHDILTSADLISEGTDIPRCSVAILLRPTHSLGLFLQQVGRVLRPYPGKARALILDHVGNVIRHGFPDDDREWSLDGVEKSGKKRDADLDNVKIAQCKKCYFVYETGPENCPECGHYEPPRMREIKQTKGDLEELKREVLEKKRLARIEQGKAQSFKELEEIAKKTGRSPGWAYHVWKSRKKRRRA